MEKRKLSGKTILKLAGALLALAYLGFYFYDVSVKKSALILFCAISRAVSRLKLE